MGDRKINRKENGEKGINRSPKDSNGNVKGYLTKTLKKFLEGKLNGKQLHEAVNRPKSDNRKGF